MEDTLFFYSKSADKPAGKGSNEYVANPQDYDELNSIKDWRKILSNFYYAPFVYDGRTYNTAEHAFQSAKIRLVDPIKANWFTVESGHPIGQGDGLVARQNRKLVVLDGIKLSQWNNIKYEELYHILLAKFYQVALAKKVLLATGKAVLLHRASRTGPIERQHQLEKVRATLSKISKKK